MKRTLLFVILICSNLILSQTIDPQIESILDTVISKSKTLSLYANTVDWEKMEMEMYSAASSAQKIEDLKPSFEILINTLRDHHGQIRLLSDYSILASFTDHKNSRQTDDRTYPPKTWVIVNDTSSRFEYGILSDNIGYLKIVGVGPQLDGQKEAQRIRNAVIELHNKKVDRWIIDLRYNGGGNSNVMLTGIAPLFDTNKIASIRGINDNVHGYAEINDAQFSYFSVCAFPLEKTTQIKNPKIAILTSRWTISSGELVAVAFKGQRNTRFFGEKTGGYTTNNCWEVINDQIALVISTGIFCDRNGIKYLQNIPPDEEITFEVTKDRTTDKGILQAANWLISE